MVCDARSFEVGSRREGRRIVVALRGEVDVATAGELRDELERLVHDGCREVRVDLAQVTFMDAAGLRVLIDGRDNLSAAGGELSIGSQSQPVRRLLQVHRHERFRTAGAQLARHRRRSCGT